jgi:signal peptidase I
MSNKSSKLPATPESKVREAAAPDATASRKLLAAAQQGSANGATGRWVRETIESVVVAFVLAFLFRTFEAEAFVIPTGSMAPTLQGRHKDLICPKCDTPYRVGASSEVAENLQTRLSDLQTQLNNLQYKFKDPGLGERERARLREEQSNLEKAHSDLINDFAGMEVVEGTCPNCRYTMNLDPDHNGGHRWPAYNGDRILVAKFPYDFADPKRWDVVVFRYPGNAQMNYIKRLVGLPHETVKIEHGDIYVKPQDDENFEIVRKPPEKIRAMAQAVYDNDYVVKSLNEAGWPIRWQPIGSSAGTHWESPDEGRSYETAGGQEEAWIRYQHFIPAEQNWREIDRHERLSPPPAPHLITDFYAYNTGEQRHAAAGAAPIGLHWVSDLMLEATLDLRQAQGSVVLDLVKGGRHFQCEFNIQSGEAKLAIDGVADFSPTAQTAIKGVGSHRVAWANIDRQLLLWIDGSLVSFSASTEYGDLDNALPTVDDLAPAGIATRGADVKVEHLLLKRDIYYIAKMASHEPGDVHDYDLPAFNSGTAEILKSMDDPRQWTRDKLFGLRRSVEFQLEADQFFVLGDNSPMSKDSRLWAEGRPEFYVRRELLIGQALFIYWPASHNKIPYLNFPFPLFPNFKDMGFVR